MTTDPPLLSELRPDAPEELVGIVHKALAKDRDARYQSCNRLLADLEALIVQMGQSITQSRLADFVRAYSPPKGEEAATGGTNAELSNIEEQSFGTGAVPAIAASFESNPGKPGRKQAQDENDPGTKVMENAGEEPRSRALLYGGLAFLIVALLIGGGVWYSAHNKPDEPQPVEIARAPIVQPKIEPKVEAPPPVEPPKPEPPAEVLPKHPRRVAVEPPPAAPPPPMPAPVMVITQQAPAPPPVIAAKGELIVQTRPWAKLEIDGREAGQTPLPGPIKLTAGTHSVKMSNPDLGKEVTRQVEITAGQTQVLKEILDEQ